MVVRLPAALIAVAILGISLALHLAQTHAGLLQLERTAADYGAETKTGSRGYPRSATDAEGYSVEMARPAHRVASQSWSIDEFVYAVLPPEDVISVSAYAYDRKYSNVSSLAEKFHPAVSTDAEVVLNVDPDLLLVSSTGRADFTELLRKAGVPVFRMFTGFTSLDEVDRAILVIGYLTGQDDAAHRIHNQFLAAIERAKARKPQDAKAPRILGYAGRYGYGDQTFFNDVIRAVGGVNVAAEHGVHGYDPISSEDVLRWNPDWIVAGTPNGNAAQELQRLLQDPVIALTTAAQNGQVLVLDNKVFLPMSPFSTQLLDALGEALYAKH